LPHSATPHWTQLPDRLTGLAAVLDAVRAEGPTTRSRLVHATGLSRAVISQRVAELVSLGLIGVGELGRSTGGRAPRMLRFRAEAGHLLVADVGATHIHVAVTDLAGAVLAHAEEPCNVADGPRRVLDHADELFRACTSRAADRPGRLLGIGIGVPGPVEFATGRPVAPPIMPGWDGYSIRERFTRWGAPVWVDNDVNVMALAELRAGIARGHRHVVLTKLGTGIGAGIVLHGRLHRGAQGCAGDIGHIQVREGGGVQCRCGNLDCLEAYAGGAALAREAEAAVRDGRSPFLAAALELQGTLEARDVSDGAAHGDAVCIELLAQAGRLVGEVLAGVVSFVNPGLLVVAGGVSRSGDLLLASIRESLYGRSLPMATRDLVVARSGLDRMCGVIGAATMVADELLSARGLGSWRGSARVGELRAVRRAVTGRRPAMPDPALAS
jgi:glucokinase-like ROK family protein